MMRQKKDAIWAHAHYAYLSSNKSDHFEVVAVPFACGRTDLPYRKVRKTAAFLAISRHPHQSLGCPHPHPQRNPPQSSWVQSTLAAL